MNSVSNYLVLYGGRKLFKGACFVPPLLSVFARSLTNELQELHSRVIDSKRTILLFEFFQPDEWCRIPEDATAFANRGRHQNLLVVPYWSEPEDDQACRECARKVAVRAKEEIERVKDEADRPAWMEKIGEYGNYDGEIGLLDSLQTLEWWLKLL